MGSKFNVLYSSAVVPLLNSRQDLKTEETELKILYQIVRQHLVVSDVNL